ncbi:hypothetical protein [Ramlibacter alkalitolerans]|uniref:Uncharacterized protein n=1 Tax=Ramlibacter alkalitolerans TaxID=2039631 RepID=A0ABS1JU66_9BURK|nr:hypothetical protein [Ramlibacter alkalitolerans]MBL0427835.1 hypothetical protein [Ramlibacter alkalitolerans]
MSTILANGLTYWVLVLATLAGIHTMRSKAIATGSYRWAYLTSLVMLPGTYLHELAHATAGLFLNAQPLKLSVVPRIADEVPTFGTTEFGNLTWYNAAPVGLAPLALIPLSLVLCGLTTWDTPALKMAEAFLVGSVLYSSIPSYIDMAFAKRYWWGPFLVAGTLGGLGYWLYTLAVSM